MLQVKLSLVLLCNSVMSEEVTYEKERLLQQLVDVAHMMKQGECVKRWIDFFSDGYLEKMKPLTVDSFCVVNMSPPIFRCRNVEFCKYLYSKGANASVHVDGMSKIDYHRYMERYESDNLDEMREWFHSVY